MALAGPKLKCWQDCGASGRCRGQSASWPCPAPRGCSKWLMTCTNLTSLRSRYRISSSSGSLVSTLVTGGLPDNPSQLPHLKICSLNHICKVLFAVEGNTVTIPEFRMCATLGPLFYLPQGPGQRFMEEEVGQVWVRALHGESSCVSVLPQGRCWCCCQSPYQTSYPRGPMSFHREPARRAANWQSRTTEVLFVT